MLAVGLQFLFSAAASAVDSTLLLSSRLLSAALDDGSHEAAAGPPTVSCVYSLPLPPPCLFLPLAASWTTFALCLLPSPNTRWVQYDDGRNNSVDWQFWYHHRCVSRQVQRERMSRWRRQQRQRLRSRVRRFWSSPTSTYEAEFRDGQWTYVRTPFNPQGRRRSDRRRSNRSLVASACA